MGFSDTVIDAFTGWLAPPNVVGLNEVYGEPPWFEGAPAWQLEGDNNWGSIGFVHLLQDSERRIAMGGPGGGIKQITCQVAVVILFKYIIPVTVDVTPGSASDYRYGLNTVIDGVKERIRQDRTLGTAPGWDGLGGIQIASGGSILMVGEGDAAGSPDLETNRDLPQRSQDGRVIWSWNDILCRVVGYAAT